MESIPPPVVVTAGGDSGPLVVLLHGRGGDEERILELSALLPETSFAAVRGPVGNGDGYAWFENHPLEGPDWSTVAATMAWFREWLDDAAGTRPVVLVGFSSGAAFTGGLILSDPGRYAGAAVLYGTLPFDSGLPATPGRLSGLPVFVTQGEEDEVIPAELSARTWAYVTGESGADATAQRYPGGHGFTPASLRDLSDWLIKTVAAAG
ncbi:MAG TPA: dienelactone hydrolase family protein [Mycobacteriales bacterium]|jgi:phospholipase/carboxylesterase|nr:dienelactone hydrolase family protein [Mycobacteriales bacterium]